MEVLDAQTMQARDAEACARESAAVFMRRAGRATAAFVRDLHAKTPFTHVVAFAGPGNNGGDAFAACAEIHAFLPCTVLAAPTSKTGDARTDALTRAREAGVRIAPLPVTYAGARAAIPAGALVLDGLFGLAGRADMTNFAESVEAINASRAIVVALDLPSGVDATTGLPAVPASVRATHTLCFGYVKLGALQGAAGDHVGAVHLADIGMPAARDTTGSEPDARRVLACLAPGDAQALLPARPADVDKRGAGAPLLIAGAAAYPGAAVLSARGAARMGAGYVTVVTAAAAAVRAHCVEQVVIDYDVASPQAPPSGLTSSLAHCGALGIGPGLLADDATGAGVRDILTTTRAPVVIDAGAIRCMREHLSLLRSRPCVLTPHAGEFAALCGMHGRLADEHRLPALLAFVERTGITTLLKGGPTYIGFLDPRTGRARAHVNPTGTAYLATAGTGDVLTGMIATLLAQGLAPVDAARLGAYVHGLAGRAAGRRRERGVVAGDLLDALPEVWSRLRAAEARAGAVPYLRVDDAE